MPQLDYTAVTSSGRAFDMCFPLHPETTSRDQVAAMLTQTLASINDTVNDGAATDGGAVSDGDILQALAMAMAVRARMIDAPPATSLRLMHELLDSAYAAALQAQDYSAGRS
jgi:hypothetical protein